MQTKTTVIYHFTPTGIGKVKKMKTSVRIKAMEQLECSHIDGVKCVEELWKIVWQFLIKLNIDFFMTQQFQSQILAHKNF
jgi:hypothetical protein